MEAHRQGCLFQRVEDLAGCCIYSEDRSSPDYGTDWQIHSVVASEPSFLCTDANFQQRTFTLRDIGSYYIEFPEGRYDVRDWLLTFHSEQRSKLPAIQVMSQLGLASNVLLPVLQFERLSNNAEFNKVFHFTRVANLPSIFENGLVPVSMESQVPMERTDPDRWDGRLDHLCFSLSFPNSPMFYSKRMNSTQAAPGV